MKRLRANRVTGIWAWALGLGDARGRLLADPSGGHATATPDGSGTHLTVTSTLAQAPVGTNPVFAAQDRKTDTLYVTNSGSNTEPFSSCPLFWRRGARRVSSARRRLVVFRIRVRVVGCRLVVIVSSAPGPGVVPLRPGAVGLYGCGGLWLWYGRGGIGGGRRDQWRAWLPGGADELHWPGGGGPGGRRAAG